MKLDRDKLIRAREMLGYGIETTADAAGISKNSVLRAEHEEDIRPVTARKIATALEVEVRDLLSLGQAPRPGLEAEGRREFWLRIMDLDAEELDELSAQVNREFVRVRAELERAKEAGAPYLHELYGRFDRIATKGMMIGLRRHALTHPDERKSVEREAEVLVGA